MDNACQPGILIKERLYKEQQMIDLLTMKKPGTLDGWDVSNATDFSSMFKSCTSITSINLFSIIKGKQ